MMLSTNLEKLTLDQPFCGGVCVWHESRLLFTIAKQHRWKKAADGHVVIPVAWVGGGQDIGENVRECALREAVEELGCPVSLISSPDTFWFDNGRACPPTSLSDPVLPVLIEMRAGLDEPYKPGLPIGPIVYVVIYRGRLLGEVKPDDVPGIIEVPIKHCGPLSEGMTVHRAKELAVPIHEKMRLPENGVLQLIHGGPEELLIDLWSRGLLTEQGADKSTRHF